MKILIIDDDPTTCYLIESLLKTEKLETESVPHVRGGDIIALLNATRPDLLILDFHLDGEQSLKYIKDIRLDSKWGGLPVLVTSGIDHRQMAYDAGASGFVLKPFVWQEFLSQVRRLLKVGHST